MGKIVDITSKLGFEEKPAVIIKGQKLEVNDDAETVLKILGMISEEGGMSNRNAVAACSILFTEEANARIKALKLNFEDYMTLMETAIDLATGSEEDETEGNEPTPATT